MDASSSRQDEFGALLDLHSRRLRRLCRLLLADGAEADEVVQDVLVKALEAQQRQGPPDNWGPWLTRIAVNTCRDRRRAGWWRRFRHWSEPIETVPLRQAGPTPEDLAISVETRQQIWRAFRALPDRQREVFVLRHTEGLSGPEIATTLGLSAGTVKRHLFRAVRRMRETLEETE